MEIKDCMHTEIFYARVSDTASRIAKMMEEYHIGSVPICDDNDEVVGMVTDRDIVLRCVANDKDVNETPASEFMTTDIFTTSPTTDVDEATGIMEEKQIRRLPIVEGNKIVGIVSIADLLQNPKTDNTEIGDTMKHICNCKNNH